MNKFNAVLLIGPTGSGKTPFGEFINSKQLFHKNCIHFDFGANLRKIEQLYKDNKFAKLKTVFSLLADQDINIIIDTLKNGTLLENEYFYIAENILLSFIKEKKITENDVIVLNAMPRHTGQAINVDNLVNIIGVIYMNCTDDIIYKRINTNSAGDRTERNDDTYEEVKRKLIIFKKRTIKLIKHYKDKKAEIFDIKISEKTCPKDIYRQL